MHVPDPEPGGVLFLDRTMSSRYQTRWLAAPLAVRALTGRGGAIVRWDTALRGEALQGLYSGLIP